MKLYLAGGVIPESILSEKNVRVLFSFSFIYIPNFKWGGKKLFKKYSGKQ